MKSVRKWVDRVSLAVFAVSSLLVIQDIESIPEISTYYANEHFLMATFKFIFAVVA